MSFEAKRSAMLAMAEAHCRAEGREPVVRGVTFRDDAVPRFLRELRQFHADSRKAIFRVR